MKLPSALAALALLSTAAHAFTPDPKALAEFDLGYAKCEARFEQMKDHRDEAYLALWKVQPDEKARAELAKARKTPKYKEARSAALKTQDNKPSPELEEKLRHQCTATWNEAQRLKTPAVKQ